VKSGEAKGGIYVIISKCNYGMLYFAIVMGPVRVWRKTTILLSPISLAQNYKSTSPFWATPYIERYYSQKLKKAATYIKGGDKRLTTYQEVG
jgi:hypothetical protein